MNWKSAALGENSAGLQVVVDDDNLLRVAFEFQRGRQIVAMANRAIVGREARRSRKEAAGRGGNRLKPGVSGLALVPAIMHDIRAADP